MVVNFTPNINLAKPTDVELAAEWARFSQLQNDNNVIIEDETDIMLQSHTPTFIGITTNPSVGAGSIAMEYQNLQGFIFGRFLVSCLDPGVAVGSGVGAYGISLPTLLDTSFHNVGGTLAGTPGTGACVGEGFYTDNSSVDLSGTLAFDVVHITGVAYLRPITETYVGKTQRWIGPGLPANLATLDKIAGYFCYKAA